MFIKFKNILFFVVLMFLSVAKVDALSLSQNDTKIKAGENSSIELFANLSDEVQVNSIEFTLVYSTYDMPVAFRVSSDYVNVGGGMNHKVNFNTPVSGKIKLGTINVNVVNNPKVTSGSATLSNVKAITVDGTTIQLNSQNININIGNEEIVDDSTVTNESINNIIKSVDSNIVNIKIKENIFEYNIKVSKEIKELDLKPVLKDDSYNVEISTQKIDELTDNKIIITVKKDDFSEVYTFNVELVDDIKIDESKFISSFNYKSKWVTLIFVFSTLLVVSLIFVKRKK